VTLFADLHNTVEELMKRADLAMYKAKEAGKNTMRFFDPEMEAVVSKRTDLENELRISLHQRHFVLFYQPQINSQGKVTGSEALVRWIHPERGMVSPADFIPVAETTGLILPLGQMVLEIACAQLSVWAQNPATEHLTIAVNVSARQFRQGKFVEQVLDTIKAYGTNPYRLKLELTESMLLEDVEDIIDKMMLLKASGVGFSLDDFGTGYSSLSYLKHLPLDQLKIDQSFVRDILVDPHEAAISQAIVTLAQSLGLAVIAEGVETAEQRDCLAKQGCFAYQGYYFSRPLPIDKMNEFLEKQLQVSAS
jgi:EAL domain-containing protein (putative c-di-GMP-specific phosphodiesterase class I)